MQLFGKSGKIGGFFKVVLKKFGLSSIIVSSITTCILLFSLTFEVRASDFNHAWRNKQKALVIDAYEKNPIDWNKMVKDKRIRGFIGKSSDGLASPYACGGNTTKRHLCKKTFQNYFMKQQLYHTRKALAKALGLKWGAYHLGRPGNPIQQANHFINFTKPEKDDLLALDIEHDDPKKWISFKDAEIFAKQVYKRIGRYPVLYTNHDTAKRIAARRDEFPLLSRMQLWYARFKGDIRGSFPMGNWEKYTLWQFSAHPNCNKRRCLYRVPGTESNIDVNVSTLSIAEFDKAWPFDGLVPERNPKPEQLLVQNEKPEIDVANTQVATASFALTSNLRASDKILQHLNPDESFQVTSIDLDDIVVPSPRGHHAPEIQKSFDVAALEDTNIQTDAVEYAPILVAAIPTKAVREIQPELSKPVIASVVPTLSPLTKPSEPKETKIVKAKENLVVTKPVVVATAPIVEETIELASEPETSFGITTTDFEPEYKVIIPKSDHAEDLTMQLQYLSGAF